MAKLNTFKRFSSSCRLCSFSGYSTVCEFHENGKCPYEGGLRYAKNESKKLKTEK